MSDLLEWWDKVGARSDSWGVLVWLVFNRVEFNTVCGEIRFIMFSKFMLLLDMICDCEQIFSVWVFVSNVCTFIQSGNEMLT